MLDLLDRPEEAPKEINSNTFNSLPFGQCSNNANSSRQSSKRNSISRIGTCWIGKWVVKQVKTLLESHTAVYAEESTVNC